MTSSRSVTVTVTREAKKRTLMLLGIAVLITLVALMRHNVAVHWFVYKNYLLHHPLPSSVVRDTITSPRTPALCRMLRNEKNPELAQLIVRVMGCLQDSKQASKALIAFFEREENWDAMSDRQRREMAFAKQCTLVNLGFTRTPIAISYLREKTFGNQLESWNPRPSVALSHELTAAGLSGLMQGAAAHGLALTLDRASYEELQALRLECVTYLESHEITHPYDTSLPDEIQRRIHLHSQLVDGLVTFDAITEMGFANWERLAFSNYGKGLMTYTEKYDYEPRRPREAAGSP